MDDGNIMLVLPGESAIDEKNIETIYQAPDSQLRVIRVANGSEEKDGDDEDDVSDLFSEASRADIDVHQNIVEAEAEKEAEVILGSGAGAGVGAEGLETSHSSSDETPFTVDNPGLRLNRWQVK